MKGVEYARRYLSGRKASAPRKLASMPRMRKSSAPKKRSKRRYSSRAATSGLQAVKKQLKTVRRRQRMNEGTLIYRSHATSTLSASVAQQGYANQICWNIDRLETVLSHLQYYDPSNPATLITAAGTTGTFQKEFLFKRLYSRVTLRNNYIVPVRATVYVCRPKMDTNITPEDAYEQGATDVGIGSTNSPFAYVTDSDQFNELWRIEKTYSRVLMPGREMSAVSSHKPFSYDPASVDQHAQAFQARYGCLVMFVRIEGVLGHDTSLPQITSLAAGVDISMDNIAEVTYDAGADIKRIVISDTSAASFTNGGVCSAAPVADNQGLSTA